MSKDNDKINLLLSSEIDVTKNKAQIEKELRQLSVSLSSKIDVTKNKAQIEKVWASSSLLNLLNETETNKHISEIKNLNLKTTNDNTNTGTKKMKENLIINNDNTKKVNVHNLIPILCTLTIGAIWYLPILMQVYSLVNSSYVDFNNNNFINSIINRIPGSRIIPSEENVYIEMTDNSIIDMKDIPYIVSTMDFLSEISFEEARSFYNYLNEKPFLGLAHPVGQKLYEHINNETSYNFKNKKFFRGRKRKVKGDIPYSDSQLFQPPDMLTPFGRANCQGISALYLTDNIQTVIEEVGWTEGEPELDIIEVEFNKEISIFDLTHIDCPITEFSFAEKRTEGKLISEYLIPIFIADCCKAKDVEALVLKSSKNRNTKNYIFFDCPRKWFPIKNNYIFDGTIHE